MIEIFLGQIPEAIYFALFMIYAKDLKEKRILFTILMIVEYLLLKLVFPFNIRFQIAYTFITFLILKMLYKQKVQITDIFTFTIGSIILILSCAIPSFIFLLNPNFYILYTIITRILMFLSLFILKDKLYLIQNLYKKIWNRNDKIKKKIKTTTFRGLNIVIFNIIFYIINLGMIFAIYYNSITK